MKQFLISKFLLFSFPLFLSLIACNNSKSKNLTEQVVDIHTSENALDWQGVYKGVLPCADCEGIETTLTLNDDKTYTLVSQYLGKEASITDTLQGTFAWEGSSIKLGEIPENSRPNIFKVEENGVRQLDIEGNIITGDLEQNYILSKLGNKTIEDKRWQLIELNGNVVDGNQETHYIIFHSNEGRIESKANCNNIMSGYTITNQFQLQLGPIASTKMACPDNIEQEYTEALGAIDNLTTDGTYLSLNKSRMAPLIRFKLAE
ncbi:MAG TPA: copper resistance protein NlpE N-terminal domain-containing protein [Saprospiraceae bacterium]|nr:copper resistance protein NlpE N-terminal domain-containing protein [Saprospiraceae bacterium]